MANEINIENPFIVLAVLALVFSFLAIGIAIRLEMNLQFWIRALNRIEWMLGINKTRLMTFKEFREKVRKLEEDRTFDREKYNKFGIYDDYYEDDDEEEE